MKVTTEITRKDLVWVNFIIIPRIRSTYIYMTVFASLCFIFIVWKDGLTRTDWEWVVLTLISIFSGICGILGMFIWSFLAIYCSGSNDNGTLGKHHYEITDNGLREETIAYDASSKWEGIDEIIVVKSFLLFKLSSYMYNIIPQRSFSSEKFFQDFVTKSQVLWNKAHNIIP